jgi:hypothetical protein
MLNFNAAVPYATWNALYDIRVNMDSKENPVKLIYKAAVTQSTGEVFSSISVASLISQSWLSPE